jgi:hypothetical protein
VLLLVLTRRARRRAQAAPPAVRGRWRIVHIDDGGQRNVRVIRPLGAHPQLPALIAWCELRQRQRGFLLRQIESAVDMRDGRRIDAAAWIAAQRAGRRSGARPSGPGASTLSPASLGPTPAPPHAALPGATAAATPIGVGRARAGHRQAGR